MIGLLSNKELEQKTQFSVLNDDLLEILNETVEDINSTIENKDGKQEKLKFSQVKIVQKNIQGLIEKGRDLFNKAKSKEEKENIIEQILTSVDYMFAKTNTKKLFVRYPVFKLEDFKKLTTRSQVFKFILPKNYNIKDLSSVSGGNCYMMGVIFYYNLIKEIIGEDEDIKFKFHIDSQDNHGTMSINDIFFIDSNITEFFKKIGKEDKKTNFYRLSMDEKLSYFLEKLGVFEEFDNIKDFIDGVNKLQGVNTSNFLIGGKDYIRFMVSKKGEKIFLLFLKKVGGKMIYTEIDKKEKDTKELNIDYIIKVLINEIARSKKDRELLSYIFSKLDRDILESIFSNIGNPNELKFKALPGF